ncbi:unnamed protein product, partial [Durusdinium trenchii]
MVVQQMPLLGHRLKVVLPVPTSMVRVHHHINDIMADIVTVLGRLASGIFIFSLLTVMCLGRRSTTSFVIGLSWALAIPVSWMPCFNLPSDSSGERFDFDIFRYTGRGHQDSRAPQVTTCDTGHA